jgi:hypothetical protein
METTVATRAATPEGSTASTATPVATNDRLAELVMHLTECPAPLAVAAVNEAAGDDEPATQDDRLLVVAKAMVSVKHGIDLRR